MGQMTIVSILNDGWNEIKKNPQQFIDNIERGMHTMTRLNMPGTNSFSVGRHANPMRVHTSFHDSQTKVFVVGQGCMCELNELVPNANNLFRLNEQERKLEIVNSALERHKSQLWDLKYDTFLELAQLEDAKTLTRETMEELGHRYDLFAGLDSTEITRLIVQVMKELGV